MLTIPGQLMSIFLMLMLVPDVGMRQNNGYAWYSRRALLLRAPSRRRREDADVEHSKQERVADEP